MEKKPFDAIEEQLDEIEGGLQKVKSRLPAYSKSLTESISDFRDVVLKCERRPRIDKARDVCALSKLVLGKLHAKWSVTPVAFESEIGDLLDILPRAISSISKVRQKLPKRLNCDAVDLIEENLRRRKNILEVMGDEELSFHEKKDRIVALFPPITLEK